MGGVVLGILVAALGVSLLVGSRGGGDEAVSPSRGDAVPHLRSAPVVRIAVAGDTGTGDAAQAATARQMVQQSRAGAPYDALVLLGDLVYEGGDADLVDEVVTEPFKGLIHGGAELIPVLGNHDYESGEQDQIMAALGRHRSWYVERVGPVRVIALDSERVADTRQQRWLGRVLAAHQPRGTWTIAAMHHPAYSAGEHGSTEAVRDNWVPLFARHDVALVLAGHDHDYQRSKPLHGVTYVVSGGGARLRPTGQEDFTEVSSSTLHFLDLLAYDDRLVCRAIDQSGRLVDSFTLRRQTSP